MLGSGSEGRGREDDDDDEEEEEDDDDDEEEEEDDVLVGRGVGEKKLEMAFPGFPCLVFLGCFRGVLLFFELFVGW